MKRAYPIFVISVLSFVALSFYKTQTHRNEADMMNRDVVLQFVTYNGYGNNLYIDNVLTGVQTNNDIAVTSFLNISYDTTYSVKQSGTDTISPIVTVSNIGRNSVPDSVKIYLTIEPGGYSDSARLSAMSTGQSQQVQFKTFTFTVGSAYYLRAFASYSSDTNRTNDTLKQYSAFLPGFTRNVLYEEVTSNQSPSCSNNNSFLNAFVNANIQTVTAIKYHSGLLGRDTFYNVNPSQNDTRRRYYYVTSVPTTVADGKTPVRIPYGDSTNLYTPYLSRLAIGAPLQIQVSDERIEGDSIRTTISVNIISAMLPGDYKLRVCAVERYVRDTLQAPFGQSDFYDVFRLSVPDTNGVAISTDPGTHEYQYTYYRDPLWVDSMIYTAAFIQNDNTKEVINCGKSRNIVQNRSYRFSESGTGRGDPLNVTYNIAGVHQSQSVNSDTTQTTLNVELFEGYFPPAGWRVYNQDGYITFRQYNGANGPTIGGSNSVIMPFFDYNIPGQRDSMTSKFYSELNPRDTVRFDYAYAQYNSVNIDSLIVRASSDGGETFPVEIFRKGGLPLATAPQTTSFFIPSNSTQWRSYKFPLSSVVSVMQNSEALPKQFDLLQNYPNPFNPSTKISYAIPVEQFVTLKIYDILGREMKTLVSEKQEAGVHEVIFSGSNFPSGVYFYKLESQGYSRTRRMVLLK